jgi:hypothetical protein
VNLISSPPSSFSFLPGLLVSPVQAHPSPVVHASIGDFAVIHYLQAVDQDDQQGKKGAGEKDFGSV